MTYQYPIQSTGNPPTVARDARPHRCGKCANPFTGGNEACVNNPYRTYDPIDAELARIIAGVNL